VNVPSEADTVVCVRAFLTDEHFGYEHWQARQFCAPDNARPAVLVICETPDDAEDAARRIREALGLREGA
jgi:hypothetical protein